MIALPISAQTCLSDIVIPALSAMPPVYGAQDAQVLLIAIALQESSLSTRQQYQGPAHGLWQCEENGCAAVLYNPASRTMVLQLCAQYGIAPNAAAIYAALLENDLFAASIARMILWCDPQPLPVFGSSEEAWDCYVGNWRPGKPRPIDWNPNYATAYSLFLPAKES